MFLYLMVINVLNFSIYILYNAGVSQILEYIDSLALFLLLYIWMIPVVFHVFRRIKLTVVVYIIVLFLFFIVSYLRPTCRWGMQYNNYALWVWGTSVPSIILMGYVPLTDELDKRMVHLARVVGLIIVPIYLLSTYVIVNRKSPEYYMFFSSGTAVLATILMVFALDKKSPKDMVLSLVLSFLILSGGARSNLIQVFAVVIIYYVLREKGGKITIFFAFLLLLYYLFRLYADRLLEMTSLGESRTVRFLLSGNFMETNRLDYYRGALRYLGSQSLPVRLFGLGLGGERRFIVNQLTTAGYVHQIFIEMILQFGYVGGSVVIALFLAISAFTIRQVMVTQRHVLVASILCAQLVPLLVSSSYIATSSFHIWMGFCLRTIGEYHKRKGLRENAVVAYMQTVE